MLKVGDKVNVDLNRQSIGTKCFKEDCGNSTKHNPNIEYLQLTKVADQNGEHFSWKAFFEDGTQAGSCAGHGLVGSDFIIYKDKNNKNTNMSITSKLKELLRKEPQKSLVKTGILDDNEEFTTEGKEVFLNYLLEKNIDDFNTSVVQPLLAAQKEEKSS